MKRIVATWATLAVLGGCGAEEEEPRTVMEALIEREWFTLAPNAAIAPYVTFCGHVNPDFVDGEYNEFADDYCTVVEVLRFYRDDGEPHMDLTYYLYDMGEPMNVDAERYGDWMQDEAFYCTITIRFDPRPIEGLPETDAQELPNVVTDVTERCAAIPVGAEGTTRMYRSTRDDVYFEQLPEDGLSFRGILGLPETGGVGPDTAGDPGSGWAWAYQACTPEPAAEGPGFCRPSCRLFGPGAGLEMCTWEDLTALPANPDVIDPDWRTTYDHLYDQAHAR